MPVIGVRLAYFTHSQNTVFCNLPNVLAAISWVTPAYPWWCSWKYYKFKSP